MGEDERIWTFAEICRRYADGERDFRGLEMGNYVNTDEWRQSSCGTFRGAVLDGADFTGSFICADFTGASLRNCVFRACVKTCVFDGADLRGADFTDAAIDAATFRSARLDGATFAGAGAYGYQFAADEYPGDEGGPIRR
jgi:hypothetical protein